MNLNLDDHSNASSMRKRMEYSTTTSKITVAGRREGGQCGQLVCSITSDECSIGQGGDNIENTQWEDGL